MSYAVQAFGDYVETNYIVGREDIVLTNNTKRLGYSILAPTAFIFSAIATIEGVGGWLGVLLTGGNIKLFRDIARHSETSNFLFAAPFLCLLNVIHLEQEQPRINLREPGLIASFGAAQLNDIGNTLKWSRNILIHHVAARAFHLLRALWCVIARSTDAVIAIPVTAMAFLSLGRCQSLNTLAYRALQAPGIINDLRTCLTKVIYPGL